MTKRVTTSDRRPHSMTADLADGRVLEAFTPALTGEAVDVEPTGVVQSYMFDSCPICGEPATDDEHVPPNSVGGEVMTRTCRLCNNELGRTIEADLVDWLDTALTLPRFEAPGVRGSRRSGRILLRMTPAGEMVLLMNGRFDPGIIEMLRTGQVDLMAFRPSPNRYRLALLKQVYLAACLICRAVPAGQVADQIRRDLLAARDVNDRYRVPESKLAAALTVMRLDRRDGEPASVPPIMTAIAHEADGPQAGILLAGQVFVSWPSLPGDGCPAEEDLRVRYRLQVGGSVDGTVSSVNESRKGGELPR